MRRLLQGAADRARRLLAFTYPRDRWYVRILFALENFWLWLKAKKFRHFVHPPQQMGVVLEAAGLMRTARHETVTWVLDLYRRGDAV
jgi:hypothetical protein